MAEVPLGETIEALRAELSAAVETGANADVQSRHIKIRASALTRSAAVATATSLCGAAAMLVAPAASADPTQLVPLSNGLEIACMPWDHGTHVHCVALPWACPRVHGDYVVDALHVMIRGHQDEYPFHCVNDGQAASWNINADPNSPFTFAAQACRKKDFEGDWCTPYADVTYTPPQPVECPAGSPTPTVPDGGTCAPVPDPVLTPIQGSTLDLPPTPPSGHTATSDVDLYDTPGGTGTVIGILKKGDAVTLNGPCPINNAANPDDPNNGWCTVTNTTTKLTGAVWGEAISK